MSDKRDPLTGVIETDNKNYAFYLDDYCITFLDTTSDKYAKSTLNPVDEFAKGVTYSGHKLIIHIGKEKIALRNTLKVKLSSYIISTSNIYDYDLSFFDGILFVGGTIRNLKSPHRIDIEYDSITGRSYIHKYDDSQEISFETSEFKCDVTIGSMVSESKSLDGIEIKNNNVYLQMMFDDRQPTLSVYKHYSKIKELMSFLTYRRNVGFDEIYLIQRNAQTDISIATVAQVFIESGAKLTEKHIFKNLEFKIIGNSLSNLMKMFYDTKDGKPSYSLEIYPESDDTNAIVTNEMVRGVCSALECEIGFVNSINSDEAEKIKKLVKQIRTIIDEHKQSSERLLDKTYDLINTNMKHWSMTASDQIKALYHMYEQEMLILNYSEHHYSDKEIDDFVKYRNHITHGSYRVMNVEIAYITHLLAGLVYCCVLSRIGIAKDKITKICKDGRMLQ